MRHNTWESLVCTGQYNIQAYRQEQEIIIRASATSEPSGTELPTKMIILDNDISKEYYEISNDIPIEMLESEKTSYGNFPTKSRDQPGKV